MRRSSWRDLREDAVQRMRQRSPDERAVEALEVMELGIRLERDRLVRMYPTEDAAAIDARLRAWLLRER